MKAYYSALTYGLLLAAELSGQIDRPQTIKTGTTKASAVSQTRAGSATLDITLGASRPQPTPGSGLSINAAIKNVSDAPVTITNYGSRLVVPPEISTSDYDYQAFIPGAAVIADSPLGENFDPLTMLTLGPGETARAFWFLTVRARPGGQATSQVGSELNFLFFVPGDYHITAQIRFWLNPSDAVDAVYTMYDTAHKKYKLYHIAPPSPGLSSPQNGVSNQDATVQLVTPQSVLLIGAAVGGLFAFVIRRPQVGTAAALITGPWWLVAGSRGLRLVRLVSGMAGAVLLSIIITILLNRISESQFLVRVSISDFWGAIAVGFIASYSGSSILTRILGQTQSGRASTASRRNSAHASETKETPLAESRPEPPSIING